MFDLIVKVRFFFEVLLDTITSPLNSIQPPTEIGWWYYRPVATAIERFYIMPHTWSGFVYGRGDDGGMVLKIFSDVQETVYPKLFPLLKEVHFSENQVWFLWIRTIELTNLIRFEIAFLSIGSLLLYFLIKNDKRK